jgi:hypothetical protein
MYVYDPTGAPGLGRCVIYAHRRADARWYVADLRTGRETSHATRTEAAERLVELAAADPALTLGGVRS